MLTHTLVYYYVKTQFNKKINVLRFNNRLEFNMLNFYHMKGIIHKKSCVNTLQQNGIAERKQEWDCGKKTWPSIEAALPIQFWGACALTANFLINWTPTSLLYGKIP